MTRSVCIVKEGCEHFTKFPSTHFPQFERTREENKEQLHQVKDSYECKLKEVEEYFEYQETHFLGHPLVHDRTTMEAELAEYRRLLDK